MAGRPRKSFAERREFALSEFREQVIDARGHLLSIRLKGDSGEVFEIPHPMSISDEVQKRIERVQAGLDLDRDEKGEPVFPLKVNGEPAEPLVVRSAKALLGDDLHARFIADGGHSNDVILAWEHLSESQEKLLESDPK